MPQRIVATPRIRAACENLRATQYIDAIIASMSRPDSAAIETGVVDVLKNVSRRPIQPTLESELVADLGFDSLQVLEVISELEDRFGITIPTDDVPATRTVSQVVERVTRLISEQPTR